MGCCPTMKRIQRVLVVVCLLVVTASAGVSAFALWRMSDRQATSTCIARAAAAQATDSSGWGNPEGKNPYLADDFMEAKQRAIDAC